MSDVAGPGAKRHIEPAEGQDGKHRANDFVKDLFDGAPQTAETARFAGRGARWRRSWHQGILTQTAPLASCLARPKVQVGGYEWIEDNASNVTCIEFREGLESV